MKEITIKLRDWEAQLLKILQDGFKDSTGSEVSDEDVIHGLFEYFVISKTIEEIPERFRTGLEEDILH